jgi:DNA (cytosine-5)-methyltransferase 1
MRPRLLDLFCGAGGAAMGYYRAGFDVVGVDINPQPNYPFEFHQADALTFPLDGFDAVHASPPCQAYTRKEVTWGRKTRSVPMFWEPEPIQHPRLLPATRDRLEAEGVAFVIENVPGAPINAGLMLCGSMFGLRIQKHRLFEANWRLPDAPAPCRHVDLYSPWSGPGRSAEKFRAAQGTPWIPMLGGASRKVGNTGDLFNAIPPAYTEFIGRELIVPYRVTDVFRSHALGCVEEYEHPGSCRVEGVGLDLHRGQPNTLRGLW